MVLVVVDMDRYVKLVRNVLQAQKLIAQTHLRHGFVYGVRPMLFVVVYGPEWEDTAYFSDMTKAKHRLAVQTRGTLNGGTEFWPFIQEYVDDGQGVFKRTKNMYSVRADAVDRDRTIEQLVASIVPCI